MYLHNDRELFREVIFAASSELKIPIPIVEKDYYVTMILKLLAENAPHCVFKGGTSLSKCHHAIDRFSEDIDITFSDHLSYGQRRKLKNTTIAGIGRELQLQIVDWECARSRRDYNCYTFAYEPLAGAVPESLIQGVKLEVSLGTVAFPTVMLPVDSYIQRFLMRENEDIVCEYGLQSFIMTLQSLERTLADKVFALCDYYMAGKISRNSRHIYDIYMLLPKVILDQDYKALVQEIRRHRAKISTCPSAAQDICVPAVLNKIIEEDVYEDDYDNITTYFQKHPIGYGTVIEALKIIVASGVFEG